MTTITLPPSLPVDDLLFRAKIDYVTVTNSGIKIPLPVLKGSYEWTRKRNEEPWFLTIHDPTPEDLQIVAEVYENPVVMTLEIAVDVTPKAKLSPGEHTKVLESVFMAVAARFRPEDKALWDYGLRGSVNAIGAKPEPLERRFARPDETVLYGHRGDIMQAKLYLKTMDQKVLLPEYEKRVRMEITLRRWACMQFGLHNLRDLFGYPYRKKFTTQFRIVDRPEVRLTRGLTETEIKKREKKMLRGWRTAGVSKFAVGDVPRDEVLEVHVARKRTRARAQLSADQFKLVRDKRANAKIGNALMGLQRRMKHS